MKKIREIITKDKDLYCLVLEAKNTYDYLFNNLVKKDGSGGYIYQSTGKYCNIDTEKKNNLKNIYEKIFLKLKVYKYVKDDLNRDSLFLSIINTSLLDGFNKSKSVTEVKNLIIAMHALRYIENAETASSIGMFSRPEVLFLNILGNHDKNKTKITEFFFTNDEIKKLPLLTLKWLSNRPAWSNIYSNEVAGLLNIVKAAGFHDKETEITLLNIYNKSNEDNSIKLFQNYLKIIIEKFELTNTMVAAPSNFKHSLRL